MNGAGAYGAGRAGVPFDPITFVQRPQVILRLLCWLFAVVVFGCISSEGWLDDQCQFNKDSHACNMGVGVGVIAFLASIALLILEAMFDNLSSIKLRRRAVMGDMAFSGFWAFMWFVTFCYLSDAWRKSEMSLDGYGVSNIRASIAFSFFSIFTWAGCVFFAFQRYRQGADAAFAPSYEADPHAIPGGSPYSSYPGGTDMNETYQEPPFNSGNQQTEKVPSGISNFQAPAY